ncbi:Trafficking protein particle complex 8 [Apophysomyces ossiformis]|uniref:Trafficking protein particle complex 8 n=1 Tax=Apophysomyces ossiformis TaxID=679940 RepID=A0A8H7BL05_9FUNG|nr:Trafficking protein particle complex 8 [Apophysomyces ossiformis]
MENKTPPITPPGSSSSPSIPGSAFIPGPHEELAKSLSPLIVVAASPDADEICQENHIPTFADFIRPFGENIEGRVSPRDWQGVPIPIDNFNVRFRHINKLDEPNHQAVMGIIDDYVKIRGAEPSATEGPQIKTRADVGEEYLQTGLDDMMPWYADFKRIVYQIRGITEHETFDHPVAAMIVISSSNADPMGTIMQLYNPNVPSFTIDKPYIDPNILRFYVLLHDPHRTTLEHSKSVFEKMKTSFGLHCYMLQISSRPRPPTTDLLENDTTSTAEIDIADNSIQNIWRQCLTEAFTIESRLEARTNLAVDNTLTSTSHTRTSSVSSNLSNLVAGMTLNSAVLQSTPLDVSGSVAESQGEDQTLDIQLIDSGTLPDVHYGRYMMSEDVDAAKAMVRELVVQSLIPFMERNIQRWNEQVASARRGLTGRLFGAGRRLFGGAARTQSPQSLQTITATGLNILPGANTLSIYPYAAPEAQMRKLADFAFMIRDYKFAHAIYDTVRRDYATEKAYKYHAGTQEMIGICLLMLNQALASKTDVDRNFELAIQQYLGRCRSPFHAMRATTMYYELLKARRMWKEVPTALVRMTGEDSDLRSALFLEQAAHCFLRAPKPMVRKYGFHLVMAGHRYGKSLQRQHAYRCYKMASLIVEDHEWSVAKNHIQFALGRQSFHLGRMEDAVKYFTSVLTDEKQTAQQQIAHIREFLFIYRKYASEANIDPLKECLPNLALPAIDDQAIRVSLSNAQSNTEDPEEWTAMELELLEENIAKGYISNTKKALAIQQQDDKRTICAVGESAIVHITLYNPLQIAITLNDLILGCEYRESSKPKKDGTVTSIDDSMISGTHIQDDMYDFGEFELQKTKEIILEPLKKRTISMAVVPRREGGILVRGLHYTLNGLVHTFRPFHKKGRRLNNTKEQRMTPTYAADLTLDILVTSPMPLLDLAFHNLPESILSGEVVQAVLEINNKGNKGLTALRLKSSHPSFICIGNPEDMDKSIYDTDQCLSDEACMLNNRLFDPSVISVPLPLSSEEKSDERGTVSPGKTTLVPLWIRGDRIGKHTFKFLFSYQSEEENAAIAHRTLRYTVNVQVLPSLKINAFTRPSTTAINEYILGIEVENLQTVANFDLNQVSAVSPMWTITPLSIDFSSKQDVEAKTSIPPRQTTFAYYKIRKIDGLEKMSWKPEKWTSDALEALLSHADHNEPPEPIELHSSNLCFSGSNTPYDAVPLKTFALNSRVNWRVSSLQNQFPTIAREQYPGLFTLYNSSDVDLTLYWDIPNMKRHGHHYIIGINLGIAQNPFQGRVDAIAGGNSRTIFEATAKERWALVNNLLRNKAIKDESPIKLVIETPNTAQHNFGKGLLKVPVRITLKNCSWNKSARFRLELVSWADYQALQSQKSGTRPSLNVHPFHWTGSTVFTDTLDPEETTVLQGYATFQFPGVYDINRWKLTVYTSQDGDDDGGYFIHWPTLSQIVCVKDE